MMQEREVVLVLCTLSWGKSRRESFIFPAGIQEAFIKRMVFQLSLRDRIFLRKKSNLVTFAGRLL